MQGYRTSILRVCGRACRACRESRFWVSVYGVTVCARCHPPASSRLVADMLATTPLALRLTKECLAASVDAGSLEQAVAMEDRNQVLCTQSSDFREGIRAFLAKRTPNYTDS